MNLLQQLQQDFQNLDFIQGSTNAWSPTRQQISYRLPLSKYSILHELGHALKHHRSYKTDIELLKLEVDAWVKAQEVAPSYGLKIPQAYINNCLDTYRNWLLARSKCPDCQLVGIQSITNLQYQCCNCLLTWSVPLTPQCLVRRMRHQSPQ